MEAVCNSGLDSLRETSLPFAEKLKSEPQNNEFRICNVEVRISGNPLRDSMFLVRYSSFEWEFGCGHKAALGSTFDVIHALGFFSGRI
jgi:hypothetical protein